MESLIPIITAASVILWLFFFHYRRRSERPLKSETAWFPAVWIMLIGVVCAVAYPIYLGARPTFRQELFDAVRVGDLPAMQALLQRRAPPNSHDGRGNCLIKYAVLSHRVDMVNLLLDKGADINYPDAAGDTPLYVAVQNQNVEMVKLLIARGADVNQENFASVSPLTQAQTRKNVQIIRLLEKAGAKR